MKCAVCDLCEPCPTNPRRCVFGGPFAGYTDGYGVPVTMPILPKLGSQSRPSETAEGEEIIVHINQKPLLTLTQQAD